MNRRVLLSGVAGVAAMLASGYVAWRASDRRAPVPTRSIAPISGDLYAMILPDLNGQSQLLSQYLGRPLLVNFWATWCAPCVQEMPELAALANTYPQVQFLGIGIDTAANMRDFVKKVPVSYPLLVAGHAGIDWVRALGNTSGGLPFTVLFDADGSTYHKVLGKIVKDDLDQILRRRYA